MAATTTNNDYMKRFIPYAIAALLVSLVGGFTTVLGPAFVADINIDYNNTTWITLALAMSSAACAPMLGKVGDVLGRRSTILLGLVIYTCGNILTAVASSLIFMLVARFVVGIGTASISPIIMAYIVAEFPQEEQAKGFSLYMVLSSAAVIIGPTCGGLIMNFWGWRAMMWVCVALCVLTFIVCFFAIKKTEFEKKSLEGFDWTGAVLVVVFFSLFLCVPSFGQNIGWLSTTNLVVMACAVVALIALIFAEKKAENPIMRKEFLFRKEFILPVVILFLTQGLMQANMTNVIVFVRYTQPDNVIVSSYAISIMYLGMTLGSMFIGPRADTTEPKRVLTFSLICTGIGAAMMLLFSADSSAVLFMAALGILGVGLGGNATILMKVALSGISPQLAGSGSGTYGLFRDLSAPFGVAVLVPFFTNAVTSNMAAGSTTNAACESAIHTLAWIEIAMVIAGLIVVQLLPKIYDQKAE